MCLNGPHQKWVSKDQDVAENGANGRERRSANEEGANGRVRWSDIEEDEGSK